MVTVLVGVLIWVSDSDERWNRFLEPIRATMVDGQALAADRAHGRHSASRGAARLPTGAADGGGAAQPALDPSRAAVLDHVPRPAAQSRRSRQPAQGRRLDHGGLRGGKAGLLPELPSVPRRRLDGRGFFAHGFTPAPLPFNDSGTIPQLTESFVFWRIAKGGPGLPKEGAPWNTAMPVWEDILTEEEIWAVIVFLYEQTGATPRTWAEAGEGRMTRRRA